MSRTPSASPSPASPWTQAPLLRILLAERLGKIEFRVSGPFRLESLDGTLLLESPGSELRWMARPLHCTPARLRHAVIVAAYADAKAARKLVAELETLGYAPRVMELGVRQQAEGGLRFGKLRHRVLVGGFDEMAEAAELMTHFQNRWRPRLVRERVEAPAGCVEITNAGFAFDREVQQGVRLLPAPGGQVTLFRLPCERWPDSPLEDRSFEGGLEFRVDNQGRLAVVNELDVDAYLRGVLPCELDCGFPAEAQRAVAVAVRSMVLSMRGLRHVTEDWHFCAGGHCFHYSGLTRSREATEAAVRTTAGDVLLIRDELCDAVSHACCGGHGENKEHIWSTPAEPVLNGRPDLPVRRARKPALSEEAAAREWILNPPDGCLCRVTRSAYPALLERSRKGFRWKEVYSRGELEEIIQRKTGVDLGTLYELVPVRRGVSGRIIELELIGSRRNLRLQKELKIREALSPGRLFSSAFVVHAEKDDEGLPQRFTLTGAGQGHGCGLCQVGAGALAEAGLDCRGILEHYFPGTALHRVYAPREA
ncbi:MAG: SpoIID/LytB domain-containing protein [Candidatus Delongbacteria bacterium]